MGFEMRGELLIAEWLYATLLYLYPKNFRTAYAQEMRLTFRSASQAAYRRNGINGLLGFWLPTLLDLLKSALEEQVRQGEIMMLKERLIALAGPLTIAVGVLWMVASIGDFAFQTGLVTDEALLGIVMIPFILSFVPLLFALIGARLRFHPSASVLGRLGLGLSVAGCAGVVVFTLASMAVGGSSPEANPSSWVNYTAVVCVLCIRLGYILFGWDALRHKLLPRWNVLPLLVGLTLVLSLPLDWFGVPAFLPSEWANPFLHFVLTGACWVLLGIALMHPSREPQPTVAF